MLTAEGCAQRRRRFVERLGHAGPVLLGDPLHLRYFANFHVEPMSLSADFGGLLVIQPDGRATVWYDDRLAKVAEQCHANEGRQLVWYTGQKPGVGPRRSRLRSTVEQLGGRVHDSLADPLCANVFEITSEMRRRKDPDEVELLKACMRATDAGHAWARQNISPGLTELDVYAGVSNACAKAAGHWVQVYGDFTVSPGGAKRGGPPTPHILQAGETFILDYSVVIQGYRSDFTNTLVVGADPTPEQQQLMDACLTAMRAGEAELKAGATCQTVYDAVRGAFGPLADKFPHHAGHGLGISHPEAPFIVRNSTETLVAGDVVTLEPGLYVDGVGGVRIEHNYLVTETGYERLSNHEIALR